jgi:two-component system sensor kinase FixL
MVIEKDITKQYFDIVDRCIVALDKQGYITLINRKGCELLGYTESELIGRNWFETCLPEQSRQTTYQVFKLLMSDQLNGSEYYENDIVTSKGEYRHLTWHNAVLRDEAGEASGTISSGIDLVSRDKSEQALHASEARIRAIVETAIDGIVTIDDRGMIRSINTAVERLFGYAEEELIGSNVSILMPSPHHEEHDKYLDRYLSTGQKRIIGVGREVNAIRKDRTIFPIRLSVSEFRVGVRRMFTGIIHDLTEQKDLQDQIIRAERLAVIGKMAAKVAHEVRNPLSSISLNAELLEDEIDALQGDNREAKSLIQSMIGEIDRVALLTDEYLQFSRLPESEPVERTYREVVEEIQQLLASEFQQKGIHFEFHELGDPFHVRLDRTQFRRVLLNIVRNAIESMPKGGNLHISTIKEASCGVINIRDTGFGIPEDMVPNIFDPFFTTKDFGTGLGLAITHQIVLEHAGHISCESTVNEGTNFRIELPLDDK